MAVQIPSGFVLSNRLNEGTTVVPIHIINEILKDFFHNSSFLIPNSSFRQRNRLYVIELSLRREES